MKYIVKVLARPALNEGPQKYEEPSGQRSSLPKGVPFVHQLQAAQDSKRGLYVQQMVMCYGPSWLFGNSLYREFRSESATAFFPVHTSFLGLSDYRL